MKIGDLVRFNHEREGGPVYRVASVMRNGMVELHDLGGYFAPHLFVAAGIPVIEKIAALMLRNGIATGHGDTVDDLLGELEAWLTKYRIERDDQDRVHAEAPRDPGGT